jgi:hypothetical protein
MESRREKDEIKGESRRERVRDGEKGERKRRER